MSGAQPAILPPTPDDRKMAMLAHVLQLFGGFIAPLIIFLVKRDSRFVRFHALQPLLWQAVWLIVMLVCFMVFFMTMIFTLASAPAPPKGPPLAFLLGMGSFYLMMMVGWVINLFLAIFFGIKAHEGQWSRYPLLGNLAWKWTAD